MHRIAIAILSADVACLGDQVRTAIGAMRAKLADVSFERAAA